MTNSEHRRHFIQTLLAMPVALTMSGQAVAQGQPASAAPKTAAPAAPRAVAPAQPAVPASPTTTDLQELEGWIAADAAINGLPKALAEAVRAEVRAEFHFTMTIGDSMSLSQVTNTGAFYQKELDKYKDLAEPPANAAEAVRRQSVISKRMGSWQSDFTYALTKVGRLPEFTSVDRLVNITRIQKWDYDQLDRRIKAEQEKASLAGRTLTARQIDFITNNAPVPVGPAFERGTFDIEVDNLELKGRAGSPGVRR